MFWRGLDGVNVPRQRQRFKVRAELEGKQALTHFIKETGYKNKAAQQVFQSRLTDANKGLFKMTNALRDGRGQLGNLRALLLITGPLKDS